MTIKISSLLEDAARKTAIDMLATNVSESDIPEMPSFRISKAKNSPEGYWIVGEIEENGEIFFILQKK